MAEELRFPDGFLWGTATSAHQVEGGNHNNDWWIWEETPGHIHGGDRSDPACGWWDNAEEDFDRAAAMGQNAHRLSVEWSRIEPQEGQWNSEAIARYRAMLTALHERGLEPMVTLHHFTNPLWLIGHGRWETEAIVPLFQRFVARVVEELGDLVTLWCTINEPNVYAYMSYSDARFPPGQQSFTRALTVMANMARAHAVAYHTIHSIQPHARVGVAHAMRGFDPANPASVLDRLVAGIRDRFFNRLILWALSDGVLRFPLGFNRRIPGAPGALDFIGLNYYNRDRVAFDRGRPGDFFAGTLPVEHPEGVPDWWGETHPATLHRFIRELSVYDRPIYITENGMLDNTDQQRPGFLLTHLAAVHRAISEGVPVKGYFHWSLVDNFEWAEGYSARFGLIHVDFTTQQRTTKRSGELYAEICKAWAITADMVQRYAPEIASAVFGSS